jgi:polyisoprenoid-binding protein YceI
MFGLAPVKGKFRLDTATVTIADPPNTSSVEAQLSSASFSTRNPLRDIQVRSRLFLHAKRHPTITFRSQTVEQADAVWRVAGQLTVKGRTAPVQLTVDRATTSGSSLVIHATGQVDRYAHGVTTMKGMAARLLSFEITATGTRQ